MSYKPRKAIATARARELLQELQILMPEEIDVERIAFFKDAEVRYDDLKGMDGCIVREGNAAVITVRKSISFAGQKRFVIAHELGHFFLHPGTRQVECVDSDQLTNWSEIQDTEEYEANLFAAELLMPPDLFCPHVRAKTPSLEVIQDLANEFTTTFTATAYQFVLNTKEECALVSCSNRRRLWFVCSPGFSFKLLEDTYVHGCSCAAEVSVENRFSRSSRIEAGYWLEGFEGDHKSVITEDSRFFPTLNRSLSLIWIHNAI